MKKIIITVDGAAASGKEKISKYISKRWKLMHLDSGILYRRLALFLYNKNVKANNITLIKKEIRKIDYISHRKSKIIRDFARFEIIYICFFSSSIIS